MLTIFQRQFFFKIFFYEVVYPADLYYFLDFSDFRNVS